MSYISSSYHVVGTPVHFKVVSKVKQPSKPVQALCMNSSNGAGTYYTLMEGS